MLLYFTILSASVSFAVVFICIVSLRKYTIVFYKTNHTYTLLFFILFVRPIHGWMSSFYADDMLIYVD